MGKRVLLILPTRSYRAAAFLEAARRLSLDLVIASEEGSTLSHLRPEQELIIDFANPALAAGVAAAMASRNPVQAVVSADEAGVLVAAHIAERLGLRSSSVLGVAATRNKWVMRARLQEAEVSQPRWWLAPENERLAAVEYPVVVKPLDQAASRGVIRVDDEAQLLAAGQRIRSMLRSDPQCAAPAESIPLLVEEFVAGPEVAVEALLVAGEMRLLAVYDKPEPLEGPFFEETIYTIPTGLASARQGEVVASLGRAVRALGLTEGAIHAELRLGGERPALIDLASRSIGGRCSRVLHFRSGRTLEEIVLLAALGEDPGDLDLDGRARGVMMLPIPKSGTLRSVPGRDEALAVPGVEQVELTVPVGARLTSWPEGDRYLGFIFASGPDAGSVAEGLRLAYSKLGMVIED
jgi:biotin carboxylase